MPIKYTTETGTTYRVRMEVAQSLYTKWKGGLNIKDLADLYKIPEDCVRRIIKCVGQTKMAVKTRRPAKKKNDVHDR